MIRRRLIFGRVAGRSGRVVGKVACLDRIGKALDTLFLIGRNGSRLEFHLAAFPPPPSELSLNLRDVAMS